MKHKKFAFTMAEVLITLGVIGVVAAMTLPPLIENYQKTVWVKQLQKNYSKILIELKQILAKIYEIAGFEDENIDLSKRSEEKASPNIID